MTNDLYQLMETQGDIHDLVAFYHKMITGIQERKTAAEIEAEKHKPL